MLVSVKNSICHLQMFGELILQFTGHISLRNFQRKKDSSLVIQTHSSPHKDVLDSDKLLPLMFQTNFVNKLFVRRVIAIKFLCFFFFFFYSRRLEQKSDKVIRRKLGEQYKQFTGFVEGSAVHKIYKMYLVWRNC